MSNVSPMICSNGPLEEEEGEEERLEEKALEVAEPARAFVGTRPRGAPTQLERRMHDVTH